MTKEEKQLLLIDLCARLPYSVTCQFTWTYCNETTDGEEVIAKENDNIKGINILTQEIQADYYGEWVDLENCKPYLRPMSSMTEEEKEELRQEHCKDGKLYAECLTKAAQGDNSMRGKVIIHFAADWCNKNHFDFRGLISMGLALEAKEEMYKTNRL